ncbi:hypothetical protein AKJ37_04930 [candidate division MSBL1 archaeon SCGC-AAA259I09]|uniref:Uncharacterized protein n=2 Tax=candidate division MSBL1 TaxID=215777 RepID=A0A133UQN1_9EURY|nr:hypothetical protein AKJ61_02280 [candidate division MSBL1 archaeon SCGC-AAA259B11]KXA96562.1 hypothetical protein AKJ37_04930 [candidate division MSBL1 archaeon SCGC-AAA259I09]
MYSSFPMIGPEIYPFNLGPVSNFSFELIPFTFFGRGIPASQKQIPECQNHTKTAEDAEKAQ